MRIIPALPALLLAFAHGAAAQSYPAKPIRIIVPFAAGGPTDTHSRWAGQQITAALGQQVIVDNRGGAGGVIGTEAAAKAAPDGYTLLGGNPGPLTIAPSVRKQLNYDALKDFSPITLIARSASCMCAHPSVPAKGLREFIALAKPLIDPAVRKQLQDVGYEVAGDGPVPFAAFIRSETEKWANVARKAGIPRQ